MSRDVDLWNHDLADRQPRTPVGHIPPIRWWLGLATDIEDFTARGVVEPPRNSGYERVEIREGWPTMPHWNVTPIRFPKPTADWGLIRWLAIFPGPDGLMPQWFEALACPVHIRKGDGPVEFQAGCLMVP